MMHHFQKRKILAAVILSVGICIAFLIISSSPSEGKPFISVVENNTATSPEYGEDKGGGAASPDFFSTSTDDAINTNLTKKLAQNYVGSLYNLNKDLGNTTGTLRMPANSVDDLLAQALSQDLAFPLFTEKDIRVGEDNSIKAQVDYMNAIGSITQKNFGGFTMQTTDILSEFFEKNNPAPLAKYITIADGEIRDLLALEVPPQWKTWHLENLNLWVKKSVVYTAILDFKNDPLKATIALNDISSLLQQNKTLQKTLSDKYNLLKQ